MSIPQEVISELIAFVQREYALQQEQQTEQQMLSYDALVALGYAIHGLYVNTFENNQVVLHCKNNDSRFRPGDRLTFEMPGEKAFSGILVDLQQSGRLLRIQTSDKTPLVGSGPWLATENGMSMVSTIIKALEKLQPGGAGWGFAQQLLGFPTNIGSLPSLPGRQPAVIPQEIYPQLALDAGIELDPSQISALMRCLALPQTLGVQGPPGTGKTMLLGFVAEGLERMGKRVVILAPTHQAVNNALSTIRRLFPDRLVIKVGDELRVESLNPTIRIMSDSREISNLPQDTIVGMTFMAALQRLMLNDKRPLNPHVVIVDEAGQLPLAQGISAGLCGAGTLLLFGDDRQMPPVIASGLGEEPYAISVFAQQRNSRPDSILMLDTTYRMNQELCDRIAGAFYADAVSPLQPDISAKDRILDAKFAEHAVNEVTRTALDPEHSLVWVKISSQKYTQANRLEAEAVTDIVRVCLESGLPSSEIAVVTPFRRHAMLIRSMLSDAMGTSDGLPIIDTVERVQGATVDIVVVTLSASQSDYVTSLATFLFSPNRMNVAISRARRKAIVISSPNLFDVLPLEHQGIIGRNVCKKVLGG